MSSRKGKENILDDTGVDDTDVSGELVIGSGEAAKGLRELVRRSTMGEETRGTRRSAVDMGKEVVELDPSPGKFTSFKEEPL